jgi:ketosteroid isomerase-like protein
MRRQLFICVSALVLAIGSAPAAPRSPAPSTIGTEASVTARSMAFAKAALDGDLAAFRAFMSDDYVMLWPEAATNGEQTHWATKTKAQWVEELSSGKNKYRSVKLLNMKIYLHGNVAVVTGAYTQTATREGVDHSETGLFCETWVKRNGQWLIVSSVFP